MCCHPLTALTGMFRVRECVVVARSCNAMGEFDVRSPPLRDLTCRSQRCIETWAGGRAGGRVYGTVGRKYSVAVQNTLPC